AVAVLGRHLARIDGAREREGAAEGSVAPFDVMELLFLDFIRELLVPLHCQDVVLDGDVDVFARHVGQFRLEDEFVLAVLVDVNRRHPRGRARTKTEITEWIPTHDGHGRIPPRFTNFSIVQITSYS